MFRGARHGQKMSGKLRRLEEAEQRFLQQMGMQKQLPSSAAPALAASDSELDPAAPIDVADGLSIKKAKKKKKEKVAVGEEVVVEESCGTRKEKKRKKRESSPSSEVVTECESTNMVVEDLETGDTEGCAVYKKSKKRKIKSVREDETEERTYVDEIILDTNISENSSKKKKSKKRKKDLD